MANKIADDPRIDPRIKTIFGNMPSRSLGDVDSRETLLVQAGTEEAKAQREQLTAMLEMCDNE
ncbi:MAG: esterase, partial [Pseudomonadales bacterium]|nr:esterase [Pseudomonadales bacterium]